MQNEVTTKKLSIADLKDLFTKLDGTTLDGLGAKKMRTLKKFKIKSESQDSIQVMYKMWYMKIHIQAQRKGDEMHIRMQGKETRRVLVTCMLLSCLLLVPVIMLIFWLPNYKMQKIQAKKFLQKCFSECIPQKIKEQEAGSGTTQK